MPQNSQKPINLSKKITSTMNKTLLSFLAFLSLVAVLPLTNWPLTRAISGVVLCGAMFFAIVKSTWLFKRPVTGIKDALLIVQLIVCCGALVVVSLHVGRPEVPTFKSMTEVFSGLALILMAAVTYLHFNRKKKDEPQTSTQPNLLLTAYLILCAQGFGQAMVFVSQH